MKIVNFPQQLYVGIKGRGQLNTETSPLGFATPYGTDSGFANRKETVERWAGYPYGTEGDVCHIIDNVPIEGFRFEKSVSRWSTSNKWFEINDPRGFSLQISADNLATIILNNTIDKGVIQGQFLWGRIGQINYLYSITDPEYLETLQVKEEYVPEIGDILETMHNKGIYAGVYYISRISSVRDYGDGITPDYRSYGRSWRDGYALCYDPKPSQVILSVYNEGTEKESVFPSTSRTLGKHVRLIEKAANTPIQVEDFLKKSFYIFHKTKAEQDAFEMSEEEIITYAYNMQKSYSSYNETISLEEFKRKHFFVSEKMVSKGL